MIFVILHKVSIQKVFVHSAKFELRCIVLYLLSPIVFPQFVYEEQNVLRMKSAEIWNYLVLCTRVYTSRVLERLGFHEYRVFQ